MSAIPSEARLETPQVEEPRGRVLPTSAMIYEIVVCLAAAGISIPFILRLSGDTRGWTTFGVLAAGAAASHTYTVRTSKNSSFHTSWVFLIPAAILLPPELVALIGVIMHVPEWLKERYPWYMQGFNICNYSLGNLATWGAAKYILDAHGLVPDTHLRWALAGLVACVVAVGANHVLLAPMITLSSGRSLREAGVFSFESLSTDFILATLG